MKTNKIKEKFIDLRAKGYSFDRIARKINVSKPTLIKWSRDFNIEISNCKAIEMDALQERFFIQKKKRVKLFGEQVETITKELSRRDLKDVPTDKLYTLLMKYMKMLKEEESSIIFREQKEEDICELNIPDKLKTTEEWIAE